MTYAMTLPQYTLCPGWNKIVYLLQDRGISKKKKKKRSWKLCPGVWLVRQLAVGDRPTPNFETTIGGELDWNRQGKLPKETTVGGKPEHYKLTQNWTSLVQGKLIIFMRQLLETNWTEISKNWISLFQGKFAILARRKNCTEISKTNEHRLLQCKLPWSKLHWNQ